MSRRRLAVGGFTESQRAVRAGVACCLQDDVPWLRGAGAQQDPLVWGLLWRYWSENVGVELLEDSTTQWILSLLLLRALPATRSRVLQRERRALDRGEHAGVQRELRIHVVATLVDLERVGRYSTMHSVEYATAAVWNEFCVCLCYTVPPLVETPHFQCALRLLRAESRVEALRVGWIDSSSSAQAASSALLRAADDAAAASEERSHVRGESR